MTKPENQPVVIHINGKMYKAPKNPMTGAELKAFAAPPIGPDRDLWLTVPGPGDDMLVTDNESVDLKNGMHFYDAPSTINPGA